MKINFNLKSRNEILLRKGIERKVWHDSLIWCPSQCELKFKWLGHDYTIYLRWRHSDPWTAELITPVGDFESLHIPKFKQYDNLDDIKKAAIEEVLLILS